MSEIETIRFPVSGMTCTSCVSRITRSLRKLDGVSRVQVDLRLETATVGRDPDRVPDTSIAAAVRDAGYGVDMDAVVVVPTHRHAGLLGRLLRRSP